MRDTEFRSTSTWPMKAAMWAAVMPFSPTIFISIPCATNARTWNNGHQHISFPNKFFTSSGLRSPSGGRHWPLPAAAASPPTLSRGRAACGLVSSRPAIHYNKRTDHMQCAVCEYIVEGAPVSCCMVHDDVKACRLNSFLHLWCAGLLETRHVRPQPHF